jgi:hypothetical protein
MLKANLVFLWDYYLGHPSPNLPAHLSVNREWHDGAQAKPLAEGGGGAEHLV